MKLIVGLGNPGSQYKNNRHNVGFMVVDRLVTAAFENSGKLKAELIKGERAVVAKPTTFMNDSGEAVSLLSSFFKVPSTDTYAIHDDLDIPLGEYKMQFGVGPKVHNGVNSIEAKLGTKDFWRVRVGIENRNREEGPQISGEEYVLKNFNEDEIKVRDTVINKVVEELRKIIA